MDRRYRRATPAIIVLLATPRLLAKQLINYCFRAAATVLKTLVVLFAQRELEERWTRLVRNYDTDRVRNR